MTHETTFNAETHEYAIGGCRIPSVTQILDDLIPGIKASEWHMQRGSTVHACAAMIMLGKEPVLDLSAQSPEDRADIEGRIEAVRRFKQDAIAEVIGVERQMFSTRYRFAGTCDLICELKFARGKKVIVDWKGSLEKRNEFQLGGYSQLAIEYGNEINMGFSVELHGDSTYKCSDAYNLKVARQQFLSLLSVYNMRRMCGVKQGE